MRLRPGRFTATRFLHRASWATHVWKAVFHSAPPSIRASAYSTASNGRRSSSCSPIRSALTGIRSSRAIESAMPPFALAVELVRTIPLTATAAANALCLTQPVSDRCWHRARGASRGGGRRAGRRARGVPLPARPSAALGCASRPAVSTRTTSKASARARTTASNATRAGVRAGSASDDLASCPLRPSCELLGRGSAERVAGRKQNA